MEIKKAYKDELARWMASPSGTNVNLHAQLETQLRDALVKLKADCRPTESQVKKLELAGRGDIKRFMDRLEQAARDFDNAPGEDMALVLFQASKVPADKIRRILDEAQWREMSRWMTIYTQGAGREDALKRNGYVFDFEPILTHHQPAEPVTKDDGPREIEQINRD